MAKYIKQEVPDMKKTGEQKVFYRMKVERNIDFQEFIQQVCSHHKGITRGEALRVLVSASETLAELLGEGYSVTLDDWGTFKATIVLEEGKEMDTLDGNESKRNARSLHLKCFVLIAVFAKTFVHVRVCFGIFLTGSCFIKITES